MLLLSCFIVGCATAPVKKQMRVAESCQNRWQYFRISKPVVGRVISHLSGSCRYKIASSTVLLTSAGDTIRILEFCSKVKVHNHDSVLVMPVTDEPESKRSAINITFDCEVSRTCYGLISKIN